MLVENFKMAVAAILANKMRAFLTMLGDYYDGLGRQCAKDVF